MANPDYYRLYSAYVEDLKPVRGSNQQYMGKCPFHEDENLSCPHKVYLGSTIRVKLIIEKVKFNSYTYKWYNYR